MSQSPLPTTLKETINATLRKSKKDLEESDRLNTTICSKEQAVTCLTAGDYIIPSKQANLHILSHVLLQVGITNKLMKPVTNIIRAVAFLIEDAHAQQVADTIVMKIKSQLTEHTESFIASVENMRDAVEHIKNVTKSVTGKMDELNDRFEETADQLAQVTQ
jgi:methyl-accepting chemotaxis protein